MSKIKQFVLDKHLNIGGYMPESDPKPVYGHTKAEIAQWKSDRPRQFDTKTFDTGAKKHLTDKLRTDLVTPEMVAALAEIMTYGSKKYADRNWEKGIPLMTLYGAALRHLVLGWGHGIDEDDESGLMHLAHAMTDIGMMITLTKRNRSDLDDRPK